MGVIRPYVGDTELQRQSAQVAIPGRRATGEDLGSGAGLRTLGHSMRDVGSELADAGRIMQEAKGRAEVSTAQTEISKQHARWTVALQERAQKADPNDWDFAKNFNEDLNKEVDTLGQNVDTVHGKEAWTRGVQELKANFIVSAAHQQATLNGVGAKVRLDQRLEYDQNALMNNPAYFDVSMARLKTDLKDPNGELGYLQPADRAKVQRTMEEGLALSAVQGTIKFNPQLAMQQLTSGQWDQYLDPVKKNYLLSNATTAEWATIKHEEQKKAHADAERRRASEAAQAILTTKALTHAANPKNSKEYPALMYQDVLDSGLSDPTQPHYDADRAQAMFKFIAENDRQARERPVTTPTDVLVKALRGIDAPYGPGKITDPNQLIDILATRRLSTDDFGMLSRRLEQAKTPNGITIGNERRRFFEDMKQNIKESIVGKLDPGGSRMDAYYAYVTGLEEQLRKDGKNPHDVYTFGTPVYAGRQEIIDRFNSQMNIDIKADIRRATGNAPVGMVTPPTAVPASTAATEDTPSKPIPLARQSAVIRVDGLTMVLPIVDDAGKRVDSKTAIANYKRTGKHFGQFDDEASANRYLKQQGRVEQAAKKPGESAAAYARRVGADK